MKSFFHTDSYPLVFVFISMVLLLFYASPRILLVISDRLFFLYSALVLLFVRIPVLLCNRELNMDESSMISQAHTLWHFPVFWDYVDGTTSGPLNSYVLFVGRIITGNFDFISARVTSLILIMITLASLYQGLKLLFDLASARLSVSLILLFYSYNQYPDFAHYSSETLPVALIGVSLWLMAIIWTGKPTFYTGFALGFLLVMIPFAKIQALPIAFFLGCFALLVCYTFKYVKCIVAVLSGAISNLLIVTLLLQMGNLWDDFRIYYIQGNLVYGREVFLADALSLSAKNIVESTAFLALFVLTAAFGLLSAIFGQNYQKTRLMSMFIPVFFFVTVYCIAKPGMYFLHYFLFLIPATGFILASSFRSLSGVMSKTLLPKARVFWGLAVIIMGANLWCTNYWNYGILNQFPTNSYSLTSNPVVEEIGKYAKPGDFLAIWGWWSSGYVQTGTIQATAEGHPVRGLIDNHLSKLYIDRYLKNLARTQPAVFVDPVGSSYNYNSVHPARPFEMVPSIRDYVYTHYRYLKTVDRVRIFIIKSLAPSSTEMEKN